MTDRTLALPLAARRYCDGFAILDRNGFVIATCDFPLDDDHASDAEVNAKAIVHACNMHDRLIAALETMLEDCDGPLTYDAFEHPDVAPAQAILATAKGGAS